MTTNVQSSFLPGLTDNATEFVTVNNEVKVLSNGKFFPFTELSFAIISTLEEAINKDKEVKGHLLSMHPHSKMARIEQFAKCRFGGLDYNADIKDGVLQDGEYWECPLRGNCKSEGVLCKLPVVNGSRLTKQEVELIQETTSSKTNEVIATDMELPMGSLHKIKKMLYQKFGVQTKQELVRIACRLNLIQL